MNNAYYDERSAGFSIIYISQSGVTCVFVYIAIIGLQ